MDAGIDYSKLPEPWRWVIPQFRAECERIAAGQPAAPPPKLSPQKPMLKKYRRHRPAVPGDLPRQTQQRAARAADIASAKASLQIQHDMRSAGVQPLGASYVRGEPT